jgi:hypothetical protein
LDEFGIIHDLAEAVLNFGQGLCQCGMADAAAVLAAIAAAMGVGRGGGGRCARRVGRNCRCYREELGSGAALESCFFLVGLLENGFVLQQFVSQFQVAF